MAEFERAEEFTRLLAKHQGRIYAYIYTIVPNRTDADEVFQEACVVLWRKFEDYRPGSNFFQWAARIAYFKVLSFRKQKKRSSLIGSNTFVEAVAEEMNAREDLLEEREVALADCIAKLKDKDRDLIDRRYAPGGSVKDAAEQLGRPIKSVYAALARVRQALLVCVERTLATEEGR